MQRKNNKTYCETENPFYRLKSKSVLAKLLLLTRKEMNLLARSKNLYSEFEKPKRDGGSRQICAPHKNLKKVQKRVACLLQRITPPDFLFSPVKGRSYVDNAAVHVGSRSIHLLDIEDFFENCTDNKFVWLFRKRWGCSPDVSVILKDIVTYKGSLPQGSPSSPILAYMCYVDMWEEISHIVQAAGCNLSVYADDITISGEIVRKKLVCRVKSILRKHGHRFQRSKERSKFLRPAEITGVIVDANGLYAPNRLHKGLLDVRKSTVRVKSKKLRILHGQQERGRLAQMNQILSQNNFS